MKRFLFSVGLGVVFCFPAGCGEDGSDGMSDESSGMGSAGEGGVAGGLAATCEAVCEKLIECDLEDASECEEACVSDFNEGGETPSETCDEAFGTYAACLKVLECKELETAWFGDEDEYSCMAEEEALEVACGFEDEESEGSSTGG